MPAAKPGSKRQTSLSSNPCTQDYLGIKDNNERGENLSFLLKSSTVSGLTAVARHWAMLWFYCPVSTRRVIDPGFPQQRGGRDAPVCCAGAGGEDCPPASDKGLRSQLRSKLNQEAESHGFSADHIICSHPWRFGNDHRRLVEGETRLLSWFITRLWLAKRYLKECIAM